MRTLILLLVLPSMASAQASGLQAWFGIGTFAMGSQKELQSDIKGSSILPVELKAVHSFDPHWTWGLGYTYHLGGRSTMGVWYEQASTGGRLSYKDYSGSYRFDQVLSCWQLGLQYQYQINRALKSPLFATVQVGYVTSGEILTSEILIGSGSQSEEIRLQANNLSIRPGLMIQPTFSIFTLQFAFGYELHVNTPLTADNNLTVSTQAGQPLEVDWSGLRFRVGLLVPIKFHKKANVPGQGVESK